MVNEESLAIIYGLSAATSWGTGDFAGGLATKHTNVITVVFISHIIGLVLFSLLALITSEQIITMADLIWGGIAGFFGGFGLIALYQGLATEKMGLIAPVSAITAVFAPMIVSFFIDGLPTIIQGVGFIFALIAILFITFTGNVDKIELPKLAVISGLGFGGFFIFISQVTDSVYFWPLISARVVTVFFFLLIILFSKNFTKPKLKYTPIIILSGIFDAGGNLFFILAVQSGRLDIATILASLFPGITVIIAWLILKEKLSKNQWFGLIIAIIGIILITTGV